MSDISVIIPAYQHAKTLERCLDAVLGQTLQPKEIIVVDDGSTDETLKVLEPYRTRGVQVYSQKNQGSNPARNRGFELSSGSRIIFLDSDAVMQPQMLEKLSRALDDYPEANFSYSAFRFGWKRFRSFPFDANRLKKMNYIHTSALIRREAFPGFDEKIKRFQDWDLWLTILDRGGKGVFVKEELFTALQDEGRSGIAISSWRPSFFYKIPWFGRKPDSVKKYEAAREVILKKHGLWM